MAQLTTTQLGQTGRAARINEPQLWQQLVLVERAVLVLSDTDVTDIEEAMPRELTA
jgi:hypothetical protein